MPEPIVLLVEDNEDDVMLARVALERAGHPHGLVVARDGEEAIDYLVRPETRTQTPAVVLLDLKLPKLDGKVVLRELRGNPRTSRVPVVVLTSSELDTDVLDAYVLGGNSYFRKPVDFRTFSASASMLLAYWFRCNVGAGQVVACDPVGAPLTEVAPQLGPAPGLRGGVVVMDGHAAERAVTVEGVRRVSSALKVTEIPNFEQAADLLRRLGGPPPHLPPDLPRLLFVDMDLPGGDARDLLQAIRYRFDHHVLLVVFTRAPTVEIVNTCYRLKVNSVVCKPQEPDSFRDTVGFISRYWLGMNTPPPHAGAARAETPRPG